MTGSGVPPMNNLMIACLLAILALLVVDRLRVRHHAKRDRSRRDKLRHREARLRDGWEAHHHAPRPEPVPIERRRPWNGVERRKLREADED